MKIGIIGCGVIGGLFARKFARDHDVMLFSRTAEKTARLAAEAGAVVADTLDALLKSSDLVFLCIKPDQLDVITLASRGLWRPDQLVVSALSGVGTADLQVLFAPAKIQRIMPNTPMQIGKGSVGLVKNPDLSRDAASRLEDLLSPLGALHWIEEKHLAAFTALAGCGPGLVYTLMEAMVDASVYMGLTAEQGRELAAEMLIGSAELVRASDKSLCEMRWDVCSPGGTTITGVKELEDLGVRAGLINALVACREAALPSK